MILHAVVALLLTIAVSRIIEHYLRILKNIAVSVEVNGKGVFVLSHVDTGRY